MAFGRRRQEKQSAAQPAEAVPAEETAPAGGTGPWDAAEDTVPEMERLDFGAVQVPIGPGLEIQVNLEPTEVDDQGNPVNGKIVAITVIAGQSSMQLQAFAAPKRSGIWEELRKELAEEITGNANGQVQEGEGPFGTEVRALIPAQLTAEMLEQMPEEVRSQIPQEVIDQGFAWQPLRFLGIDGPRWFLRALIAGEAVEDEEAFQPLEDVLSQIVVVRGDQPMPPREALPLNLPAEAKNAMGQQETESDEDDDDFDPFTPGTHITEVR
ncbi:DUF3710 domain-containing protein [Actinocorallia sp. A-T 12471]|uniref:DUF3710 domain-containing protein n=1 Tax=Actinocorallia sp. A-T 12471 TaxID=3089813 RepID=UPI0029CFF100|nr:DUF3710 domain-containing protein [Actinocorallia sp. A-T 12471]MDX6739749.1 DUF3710 domain-containing protein [Actinocorallia sp. A-T 12471]